MKRSYLLIISILMLSLGIAAQSNGTVKGTVKSQVNDGPLANVSVQLVQIRRTVETDENGAYEFTDVPPGRYTIVTHIEGFSDQARSIVVASGGAITQIPPAHERRITDPTGCGDAYRAGLIFGLMRGYGLEVCGRMASLMGALKVEHPGTQNQRFDYAEFAEQYRQQFGHALG